MIDFCEELCKIPLALTVPVSSEELAFLLTKPGLLARLVNCEERLFKSTPAYRVLAAVSAKMEE